MAIGDSETKQYDKPTNLPIVAQDSDYTSIQQAGDTCFMDEAYAGTGGFKNGRYIIPFNSEVLTMYERRKQLAMYKNFVNPIVRCTIDPVFNTEIKREILVGGQVKDDGLMANEFLKNATGSGKSLQAFIDRVITKGDLHGAAFAVVDNVPKAEQPKSVADAIRDRKFPFVYLRSVDQVDACERDKMLRLKWIRFKEKSEKDDKGKEQDRFLYYDAVNIIKQAKEKDQYIDLEVIPHGLGEIPVVVDYFEDQESTSDDCIEIQPPFYDIAKINFVIFNRDSVIIDQERKQGKGMLYVHESAPGNLQYGANNYISVETNAPSPGVVSFPPELLRALVENNDKTRDDMFMIAGQMGINIRTAQAKSADAHAWEFRSEEKNLKRTARRAQELEENIMRIFGKFANEQFEYHVEYPENFRPDSEADELKENDSLMLILSPDRKRARALVEKQSFMIKAKDWPEDAVSEALKDFDQPVDDSVPPPIIDGVDDTGTAGAGDEGANIQPVE